MLSFLIWMIEEDEGALDQWVTVVLLAVIALFFYFTYREPLESIVIGTVEALSNSTNNISGDLN